jgi:catechol 2,3-dioxygenase
MLEQTETSIHPATRPGLVALTVSNQERSLEFYERGLGLQVERDQMGRVILRPGGGRDLLELVEKTDAVRPVGRRTGLYHMAILLPSRLDLARALRRLVQIRWPIQGAADHMVSEALYLSDPDGNGIEIYRDRPRDEWSYREGHIQMATDPLDVQGLQSELQDDQQSWSGLPSATVLGHVHLKVAGIPEAEAFYCQVLGFDLVTRYGPSAAFVYAGGYNHHIGLNTWESAEAPPPAPDSVGLRYYTLRLPDEIELGKVIARIRQAGIASQETPQGLLIRDPSGNGIMLRIDQIGRKYS